MNKIFNKNIQNFVNEFFLTLDPIEKSKIKNISADYFCSDEENANICAELVLSGIKTASCSLKESYKYTNYDIPMSGDLLIVTSWDHAPVCIVEITETKEVKFSEVKDLHAHKEGEGDKSLSWWNKAHVDFFSRECEELGIEFNKNMTLILEYFKVVYPTL